MNPRRSLALLWHELGALFPRHEARFWFLMAVAALLQAGFWYLASPGPTLLGFEARAPLPAVKNVLITVLLLLLAPWGFARLVGLRLEGAAFAPGDYRFALPLVVGLWLLALGPLYVATADPGFQSVYPWPGAWAGAAARNLVLWLALYALYYLAFEYFYRGFLLRLTAERFGIGAGIWLQALAATMIHLGKPLPELVAALPISLVFGVLAVRGRSLLYPLLLHWLIGATTDVLSLHHLGALLS